MPKTVASQWYVLLNYGALTGAGPTNGMGRCREGSRHSPPFSHYFDRPLPLRLAGSFSDAASRSSGVRVSGRSRCPYPGANFVGSGRSSRSGVSGVSMPAGYAQASQNLRMAAARSTAVNAARRVPRGTGVCSGHVRPIRPDPYPRRSQLGLPPAGGRPAVHAGQVQPGADSACGRGAGPWRRPLLERLAWGLLPFWAEDKKRPGRPSMPASRP